MCKELKMAAVESLCDSLQLVSKTACANEHVMEQAPPAPAPLMDHNAEGAAAAAAALDHNAGGGAAPAASDYILQGRLSTFDGQCESKLLHMQIIAGADHNSINGSARVINSEINPSLIPTSDEDHSSPPSILTVLRRPLQLQVLAHDHDHELVALQDDQISSITRAQMQSPSKKLRARRSTEKEEEEEEEGDHEEEEEEGCVTPTARDQRIPQYNQELNTNGLVCPPAPKKKPSASKRRRLFYSADHGAANYHIVAERRAFLVDPPDLHNFPDCIRALFK